MKIDEAKKAFRKASLEILANAIDKIKDKAIEALKEGLNYLEIIEITHEVVDNFKKIETETYEEAVKNIKNTINTMKKGKK